MPSHQKVALGPQSKIEIKATRIKAILWDIDGTLFSAEDILTSTYQKAFFDFQVESKKNLIIPTLPQVLAEVGKPVKEIFQNLAPNLEEEEQEYIARMVLSGLVKEISFGKGKYYEKMTETLKKLHKKGYLFFSASNGRYPYIEVILRMSDTLQYFEKIDAIDNKKIKNKNELVAYILKIHQLDSQEVVMIGDRASDRDAAHKNNIPFIAASYGHGTDQEWEGATILLQSIEEIIEYL